MTRSFVVINNDIKFDMIKQIFTNNEAAELEEWKDGNRRQLTVKCDTFTVPGKMVARDIKRVEELYSNNEDVEVWD